MGQVRGMKRPGPQQLGSSVVDVCAVAVILEFL